MIAAPQRKTLLNDTTLCVLLTVGGCREQLPGHDEDDVLACCLERTLDWSFDIGRGGRRDVRVLPSALKFFKLCGGTRHRGLPWAEALEEIFRGVEDKPWIEGERARLILNCSSTHLLNLVEDGELETMPGTKWRRGPGGSPQVKREAFADFLKRRRIS